MVFFATKIVNIYSNFVNEKENVVVFSFGHDIAPTQLRKHTQRLCLVQANNTT
jgi:hypothetical protein